jgi:hypothetical protein
LNTLAQIKENMKIMDLINESASSIIIEDNSKRENIIPSKLNFASPKNLNKVEIEKLMETTSPPLSARVQHRMGN